MSFNTEISSYLLDRLDFREKIFNEVLSGYSIGQTKSGEYLTDIPSILKQVYGSTGILSTTAADAMFAEGRPGWGISQSTSDGSKSRDGHSIGKSWSEYDPTGPVNRINARKSSSVLTCDEITDIEVSNSKKFSAWFRNDYSFQNLSSLICRDGVVPPEIKEAPNLKQINRSLYDALISKYGESGTFFGKDISSFDVIEDSEE